MTTLARRVAESHGFQNFILGVILVTAVIVGVETSDPLMERYGGLFELADMVVQAISCSRSSSGSSPTGPSSADSFATGGTCSTWRW